MRPAAALPILAILLTACSGEPVVPPAGPTVTLVDSVIVADADTFPRREGARALAMSPRGDLFAEVTDGVLQFAPDGEFVRVLGTPGEDRGQLRQVSGMSVLPGGTQLAVMSIGRGRIVIFRIANGRLTDEVAVPEPVELGQHWLFIGDTVLAPALMGSTAFRTWTLGADTAHGWAEAPPKPGGAGARAYLVGGEFSAARLGDNLLALVPEDTSLVRYGPLGWVNGRVSLPVARRGLTPGTAEEQLREMMRRSPDETGTTLPAVLGIHQRPDSSYVLVHFQGESQSLDSPVRLEFTGAHYWISLLSADLTRSCADGQIPEPPGEFTRPIFHGDTVSLYVRVDAPEAGVHHVLRKYLVSDAGCEWMSLGG
jgi:hypothetical protein